LTHGNAVGQGTAALLYGSTFGKLEMPWGENMRLVADYSLPAMRRALAGGCGGKNAGLTRKT
jgi:hypothetical protein